MTELDELLRTGLDEAASVAPVAVPGDLAEALTLRRARRRRRTARAAVVAAAAAVLVVAAVAVLVRPERPDDGARVTNVPATEAQFADLGPGWHQLDTGPVPAMYDSSVAWTGDELVVAGTALFDDPGPKAYAYSPRSGRWREVADPPFDDSISLAWAGDQLVAVGTSFPSARAASWDPATNRWTDIGPPPVPQALAATGYGGPRPINSGVVLVWTGERLLDLTHGSVYDPADEAWTTLALPEGLGRYGRGGFGHPVWDGHEVVLGTWSTEPGLAWNSLGTSVREVPGLPANVATGGVVQDHVAAVRDGRVFVVSGTDAGTAASFDSRTDTWRVEPPAPGMAGGEGCPYLLATVGDQVISMPCTSEEPVALATGATSWTSTGPQPFPTPCCGPTWVVADDVLVVWSTSTDTTNGEAKAFVRASVWVPPR